MPFYQRNWNVVLGDQAPPVSKHLRTSPIVPEADSNPLDGSTESPLVLTHEKTDLFTAHQTLNSSVEGLLQTPGAERVPGDGNSSPTFFPKYEILRDVVIFSGLHSNIHECRLVGGLGQTEDGAPKMGKMIAREFKLSAGIPQSDLYLKILRRLGADYPTIIATYDIFIDELKHVWIFQEFGTLGNAMNWVLDGNKMEEAMLVRLAWSLFSALDHLGTLAIAHNSLQPKHILLMMGEDGKTVTGKLSSFRDALIYWDPLKKDIIDLPCQPAAALQTKAAFFRAPETFGNEGDVYNVVDADIWSLGACLFYIGTSVYPFSPQTITESGIECQIRNSIAASGLSNDGKYCLYGLMRTHIADRTNFEAIPADQWFHPEMASNEASPSTAAAEAQTQPKEASAVDHQRKMKPMGSPAKFEPVHHAQSPSPSSSPQAEKSNKVGSSPIEHTSKTVNSKVTKEKKVVATLAKEEEKENGSPTLGVNKENDNDSGAN